MDRFPKDIEKIINDYKYQLEHEEKRKKVNKQVIKNKNKIYSFNMFRNFPLFDLKYFLDFFPQMSVCERCGNFGHIELIYRNYSAKKKKNMVCECDNFLYFDFDLDRDFFDNYLQSLRTQI